MANDIGLEFEVFFKQNLIFLDVEWVDSAIFFKKISKILEEGGYVQPTFYKAITEREKNYPTGIQTVSIGAAIPHADPIHIKEPFISVVRPKIPIAFSPMGGTQDDEKIPAQIIFILGVMKNGLQVKVLQKLMGMLSDKVIIEALLQTESSQKLLEIIKKTFMDQDSTIHYE